MIANPEPDLALVCNTTAFTPHLAICTPVWTKNEIMDLSRDRPPTYEMTHEQRPPLSRTQSWNRSSSIQLPGTNQ